MTPRDVLRLLDAAGEKPAGLRLAALVATLYSGCPRLGVALAMGTGDVNLPAARMTLRGRRAREVDLDVVTLARISRWLACRADLGLEAGFLFCTFEGAPLDASYVRRALPALGREAGLDAPVSAEALRSAGAARLIAAGVGDDELQRHLDHGRAAVTARYRRRLDAGPSRAAALHPDGAYRIDAVALATLFPELST